MTNSSPHVPAFLPLAFTLLSGIWFPAFTAAADPNLVSLSPPGATIGKTVTLTISGSGFSEPAHVLLAAPLAAQKVTVEKGGKAIKAELTLAADAIPGIYPVRIVTSGGISVAKWMAIDHLDQHPLAKESVALPAAVFGTLAGSERRRIHFQGTKGQQVLIDVEARRLGASFKPVVRLLDQQDRQLGYAPGSLSLAGDARLRAVLPHDGPYTIELHDQLYRGGNPGHFRLKVGDPAAGQLAVAERVFPLAVAKAAPIAIRFPGGTLPAEATAPFDPQQLLRGYHPAPWPAGMRASGPRPAVFVSEHAEFSEARVANEIQELSAAPVGVSGIVAQPSEEDVYALAVSPGQKLRFDLIARQLGSPLDGVLTIRNEQGQQLANSDDQPGSADASVENFTVPANVNRIRLAVSDLAQRGSEAMTYRIVVSPIEQPDFSLSLESDRLSIPAGGSEIVRVQAARNNSVGAIALTFNDLPSTFAIGGQEIAADAPFALLAISAAAQARPGEHGLARLVGRSGSMERIALTPEANGPAFMPYWRQDLAWSVTEPLPLQLVWSPAGDMFIQGQPLPSRVELVRVGDVKGNVRLKLITNQPVLRKKIRENNQDKEVDDAARMVRLARDVKLTPAENAADVELFVPGDLAGIPLDLVLAAELLSADEKNVLATAYSGVKRFARQEALRLELAGEPKAAGVTGIGQPGVFTGKVIRTPGYTQPVVVTLRGLPMGYAAPLVEVPADQSEFRLPLAFPYGNKPAELKNVKLLAIADRNIPSAAKSNEIDVTVQLAAGEKPPAEKPLELFEDAEAFLAQLTQGSGKTALDTDKFSGQFALRVTPDQRFSPQIAGYNFAVRENPGPGEYRFLRFAWRKKGGNTICLQLAHDGQFGAGGSGREGASFRYHAGPGGEQFGGSIGVDGKLPGQYAIVVRDLFADFGEFTLTGLALSPVDGQAAFFDGIYLGRNQEDFELIGK